MLKRSFKVGMNMNYDDFVADNITAFRRNTGKSPLYLYVGKQEFQQLNNSKLMCLDMNYYDKETKLQGGRFFMGLKVMEVIQTSHFNIA